MTSQRRERQREIQSDTMRERLTANERLMSSVRLQMPHNLLLRLEDRSSRSSLTSFPFAGVGVLPAADMSGVEVLGEGVGRWKGESAAGVAAGMDLRGRGRRGGGGRGGERCSGRGFERQWLGWKSSGGSR